MVDEADEALLRRPFSLQEESAKSELSVLTSLTVAVRHLVPRRRLLFRLLLPAATLVVGLAYFLYAHTSYIQPWLESWPSEPRPQDWDLNWPPKYQDVRGWERGLPQHNLSLPYPEGSQGRYVKFSCQVHMLGWNNAMNEILMNSHLAYRSNRAYVFSDYTWKTSYYPWPMRKARTFPARTPLPALIAGPTTGAPWAPGDPSPRSVSEEHFNIACPKNKRKIISTGDVKPQYGLQGKSGKEVFEVWRKILADETAGCVEIIPANLKKDNFPQVFDLWLWGTTRVLDLWEEFRDSPVSKLLKTSPVVEKSIKRNEWLFQLPGNETAPDPFKRVLAIHLRRGDFKNACKMLSDYNATFYSWNLLPALPDKFTPPPGGILGKNTARNEKVYMERCLPSDDDIIRRIALARVAWEREVFGPREDGPYLKVLFLMTNDKTSWIRNLKRRLQAEQGWELVRTSGEIVYGDSQEKDVGMAIDMEIGQRAAIFIGNGLEPLAVQLLYQQYSIP